MPTIWVSMQSFRPSSRLMTIGPVNVLMVFKSVRNSLPGSVTTWAVGGRAHHVTQDHPVYIPRDLNLVV